MGVVTEIARELLKMFRAACERSPAARMTAAVVGVVLFLNLLMFTWTLLRWGAQGSRYRTYDLYGSVAYADGDKIPVDMMLVKLFPVTRSGTTSHIATPVTARVDTHTGRFQAKWKGSKGASRNLHLWKAVVVSGDQRAFADDVVPGEYGDAERTPLEVDVTRSPLELRLRRPSGTAK